MGPWTQVASPRFEREFMQYHWRARAEWSPEKWDLLLGVFADGELWGTMGASAVAFERLRSIDTGSWLLPEARGRGLGTLMRAAMVQLCFAGLEAVEVRSSAHAENAASLGVSRALGYLEDGTERFPSAVGGVDMQRMVLRRADWTPRDDVEISAL